MINYCKQKLENKELLLGSFYELGGEAAVEAAGIAGADFIIIDNEHGPMDIETTVSYISRSAVLKSLDAGAAGLIVPCIENIEEIKNLVKWAKYPPLGERGFFFSRISKYGQSEISKKGIKPYMEYMNLENWLIPQCETVQALNIIEEIAATKGVDGIFIGPFDLSNSMGIPGQFDNEEFKKAVNRVIKACHDNNKFVMYYANDVNIAKDMKKLNLDGMAVSIDINMLINGYRSMLEAVRK